MVRALPFVVLVCVLSVQSAFAADPQQIYQEATEALYNLDFSKAEPAFTGLTRDYPDNPDYWTALASTVWLKILYDQQKLNMESFSSKDRFGTSDSKDGVRPEDEVRLRSMIDQAIKVADARLKVNPKDKQALYAKGVANGTLASFEGTVKRSYMAAGRRAKAARNLHGEVLKLDPSFHDANLTVGLYNYVVGIVPGIARYTILLALGLNSDGKDVGIRQVETAAAKGTRASTDAKMMLVVVYNREQRFDDALKLIDELHAKYPRNFMFELSKAAVYSRMKKWDDAVAVYRKVAEKSVGHVDGYDRIRVERIYSELGNAQVHASKFGDAIQTLKLVTASPNSTPNEKANAHLWLGKMSDTSNARAEAIKHYKAVQALDCDPGMKEEARKYERKRFS